ncbi:hypothetical protein Micr_00475 [Candidatus Micrarchaeum sp.]|nr:hypothetical protein Micr_00475 [Candidatus Micrarchaeum sp.]
MLHAIISALVEAVACDAPGSLLFTKCLIYFKSIANQVNK